MAPTCVESSESRASLLASLRISLRVGEVTCRGTSLIRNIPPPWGLHRALCILSEAVLTPNTVELIPSLGAFFPRDVPVQDPVLTYYCEGGTVFYERGTPVGGHCFLCARYPCSTSSSDVLPIHQPSQKEQKVDFNILGFALQTPRFRGVCQGKSVILRSMICSFREGWWMSGAGTPLSLTRPQYPVSPTTGRLPLPLLPPL